MFSTRTRIARCLIVALVAVPGFVMNGCGSPSAPHRGHAPAPAPTPPPTPPPTPEPPAPAPTQIRGTGSLLPGAGGNLVNTRAAIYRDLVEWRKNMPAAFVRVTGDGPLVSFVISNLVPGTYYLDLWKDSDNSTRWSPGDFAGWFGNGALGSPALTPLQVREGETLDVGDLFVHPIVTHADTSGR